MSLCAYSYSLKKDALLSSEVFDYCFSLIDASVSDNNDLHWMIPLGE